MTVQFIDPKVLISQMISGRPGNTSRRLCIEGTYSLPSCKVGFDSCFLLGNLRMTYTQPSNVITREVMLVSRNDRINHNVLVCPLGQTTSLDSVITLNNSISQPMSKFMHVVKM